MKTKNYYTNEVEKAVDNITNKYIAGLISEDVATKDILAIDNLKLVDIDENNVGDHLFYAKEDAKVEAII
jgi:hypothetical protein